MIAAELRSAAALVNERAVGEAGRAGVGIAAAEGPGAAAAHGQAAAAGGDDVGDHAIAGAGERQVGVGTGDGAGAQGERAGIGTEGRIAGERDRAGVGVGAADVFQRAVADARADEAEGQGRGGDAAAELQRRAAVHDRGGVRAQGIGAGDVQGALRDGGRAGVGVVAGQGLRAETGLEEIDDAEAAVAIDDGTAERSARAGAKANGQHAIELRAGGEAGEGIGDGAAGAGQVADGQVIAVEIDGAAVCGERVGLRAEGRAGAGGGRAELEGAGVDRGGAGVGIGSVQAPDAGAVQGEAAGAADGAGDVAVARAGEREGKAVSVDGRADDGEEAGVGADAGGRAEGDRAGVEVGVGGALERAGRSGGRCR